MIYANPRHRCRSRELGVKPFHLIIATAVGGMILGLHAVQALATNITIYDVEINPSESVTLDTPVYVTYDFGQIVLTTSIGTIDAWCIDMFHDITVEGGQSLAYTTGPIAGNGEGGTLPSLQIAEIGGLMANYTTLAATPDNSLATQLAIWSIEYGSAFTYSDTSAGAIAETNALTAAP